MKSQRSSLILGIIVVLILVSSYAFGISVYNAEDFQRALKNKKIEYISLSGNIYGNFVLKRGNITIEGNGYAITPKDKDKPALSVLGPRIPGQRTSSINILDINFDGGKVGIYLQNITKSSIERCKFRNFEKGIYIHGATHTDIWRSEFLNTKTGIYIENGLAHKSFGIDVYSNTYQGDGVFIYNETQPPKIMNKNVKNLIIEKNTIKEKGRYMPTILITNKESRIRWTENKFDYSQVISVNVNMGEEKIYQTLGQQYHALIIKDSYYRILNEFPSSIEYKTSNNASYKVHVLNAENYLIEIYKRSPEKIEKNIGDIVHAIYDIIDIPFDVYNLDENCSFKEFLDRIYGENHRKIFWRKNNDFFNKYIFASIYGGIYTETLLSIFEAEEFVINDHPISYYIPDIPSERGEVFRGNIVAYKRYRENVQKGLKYLDWLISIGKKYFSQQNVLLLEEFKDSIKEDWPSLDKVVRILLFDIPLFEIMIEMVNTMNNGTKPKLLGETIASFGPIAYYGIVGDATKKAWEYYIVKKIKKSMKGAQFEEFKEKMRQTPDWFRDSGGRLLQESY